MTAPACPVCSSTDVRLVWTTEVTRRIVGSRSKDGTPVFIVESDPIEESVEERVICANGHSHPDRVGFDVEWAE
ncbi:MAG: hypothetical protein U9N79_11930 [Actinomycetota bacterium]|nr:hypothetical protein [Actinomycetota bacterium]